MKSPPKKILLLAALMPAALAITLVTILTASRAQQRQNNPHVFVSPPQKPRPKLDDPTPIQEGVMNERQRKHSRLYKGDANGRKKLSDLVAERGDVEVIEEAGDVQIPRVLYLDKYLRNVGCQSDAVIIGTVQDKSSQLTESGTFVFTDYDVVVNQVLKNNPTSPFQLNSIVVTTRSGGSVTLNRHVVRAIDYREEPLEINQQYLLFLKYLPETGTYRPAGTSLNEDSFQLKETEIIQLSDKSLPFKRRRSSFSLSSFMNTLNTVLRGSCGCLGEFHVDCSPSIFGPVALHSSGSTHVRTSFKRPNTMQ